MRVIIDATLAKVGRNFIYARANIANLDGNQVLQQ